MIQRPMTRPEKSFSSTISWPIDHPSSMTANKSLEQCVSWQMMRLLSWIPLGITTTITMATVAADGSACLRHESRVGDCREIRARVTYANGNPSVRIWPIGTQRILGVRESDPPLLPDELARRLSWDHAVYGSLRVCPLVKERPGHMQIVCVASAQDLAVRPK
jgi:hypothetical protein